MCIIPQGQKISLCFKRISVNTLWKKNHGAFNKSSFFQFASQIASVSFPVA